MSSVLRHPVRSSPKNMDIYLDVEVKQAGRKFWQIVLAF